MDYECHHESLDCYKLLVRIARWYRRARFPRHLEHVRDQGARAAESAVLNLAEGCYRTGKSRLHHFRIAQGSAAEAVAALDLTDLKQREEVQLALRRCTAMMQRLR